MNQLLFGHRGGDSEGVLPAITILRKVCNHPKLLLQDKAVSSAEDQQPEQQQGQGQVRLADLAVQLLQQQMEGTSTPVDAIELSGKLGYYGYEPCLSWLRKLADDCYACNNTNACRYVTQRLIMQRFLWLSQVQA
eukprot:GHUV01037776.1.p1 GENE.GHUV01037776.1~~GHUV01037776.1.p1  ORF type:complete len:135 (-),score=43.96 GHUV01037776.1:296-700(-)